MSVSIFETDMTETERRVREINQELEEELRNKTSFLERVKLAREKMGKIKEICQVRIQGVPNGAEPTNHIPDFDDMRKGIKNKILKNVVVEKRAHSQERSISNKKNKSRPSTLRELIIPSAQKKKNRKTKDDDKKMSVFIKKNIIEIDAEKKRNSAIIQGFGERMFGGEATRKTRFAAAFMDRDPGVAPRDSIDIDPENEALHRPSTLMQMRNSMFKFDTSVMVNDCLGEEELQVDEVLSDLSDCEPEVELLDGEDEDIDMKETKALKLQVLQTDNKFFTTTSGYVFNVASAFDEDHGNSDKFAQRVKIFDNYQNECAPVFMSLGDKLVSSKALYLDDGSVEPLLRESEVSLSDHNTLIVEKLKAKEVTSDDSTLSENIRQIATSSLSCCYTSENDLKLKFGLAASNHSISGFKLYDAFAEKYFTPDRLFKAQSVEDGIALHTECQPIFLGYEFTRERRPIGLQKGDEFYFNKVDGMRVDGILPAGFTEEEFEAFKPKCKQWEIECLNRHLFDHSIYKYFLMEDAKNSDKKDPEYLDKAVRECFDCPKNLSRLLKFKKEYLIKLAKKGKYAVMKFSLIRQYDSLGLNKKISEILLFYADPYTENPQKPSLKSKLKQSFLSPKNIIQIGKSLQQRLPKIRNEFERSNLLYAVDLDFDIELGYSTNKSQFYLQITDGLQQLSEEYKHTQDIVTIDPTDLRSLFDTTQKFRVNDPREGLWLPLMPNSQVVIPSQSLLFYDSTIARVSNEKVNLI